MDQKIKWEYKTIKVSATHGIMGGKADPQEINERLNELGEQGWELATSLVTHMGYGSSRDIMIIFKRQSIF